MHIFKKDGTLKKRVHKLADRLGLEVDLFGPDYGYDGEITGPPSLWIGQEDSCEPFCIYEVNRTPERTFLSWSGNIWLPQDVREEMPGTILDLEKLEEVLHFLYGEDPSSW